MGSGGEPDIEERKLRVEEGKLKDERFAGWFPTVATLTIGIATLGFNAQQSYVAYQERMRAADDARAGAETERLRQNGAWGQSVLELYVKYPYQFDPAKVSPEAASSNLSALVVVAPALMQPIMQAKRDAIVRATQTSSAAATDPNAAKQNDTLINTFTVAATQANHLVTPTSLQPSTTLPNIPPGISASDYTVYVQYGEGSKDAAAALAERLRGYGFRVPAQEQVANGLSAPQVRYYQKGQEGLAGALATAIGGDESFIGAGRNLPDGILEVWLPRSAS